LTPIIGKSSVPGNVGLRTRRSQSSRYDTDKRGIRCDPDKRRQFAHSLAGTSLRGRTLASQKRSRRLGGAAGSPPEDRPLESIHEFTFGPAGPVPTVHPVPLCEIANALLCILATRRMVSFTL